MNDRNDALDRALAELADESLDDATVDAITARVRARLADESARPLRGCEDILALIPDLVAGRLAPERALLVEDHTRHCVPCRRELMAARSPQPSGAARPRQATRLPRRLPTWLRLAALVIVLVGGAALGFRILGDQMAQRRLTAQVEDGSLAVVGDEEARALHAGDQLHARQVVRTGKDAGAMLRLADGSLVEMDARSRLQLDASRRGTTIRLERGNVIVHAADQHGGRLYLATDDCLVAVKGTIFSVNHGLKGSRVSVIEGEVEVRQGSEETMLLPGQQVTTDPRLRAVPVADEIAWSRDAEGYRQLLHELTDLHRDMARALDVAAERRDTRLLDLVPDDTTVYVAVPNLTEGIASARRVLADRLASSPVLAEWWQENVAASGLEREIDEVLDRLRPLGEAVGDEIAVAVPAGAFATGEGPLVLAVLDDPATFRALLGDEMAQLDDATAIALVEDPATPPAGAEVVLWIHDDLLAAAADPAVLVGLAERLASGPSPALTSSPLYDRLASAYASGVTWLVGVDLHAVVEAAGGGDEELLDRLGLLGARTLVVERSRVDDRVSTQAELDFDGPRRGIASWLAAPAPMGSLDFVSPQATLATAVVGKDAVEMFDDLVGAVGEDALAELRSFEGEVGIDLRADLAAALGGEGAFAVDGPLLPTPAWKLVLEVYDPALLQHSVARAVEEANRVLAEAGKPELVLQDLSGGGRPTFRLWLPGGLYQVVYTLTDGYLVAAPSLQLVDAALAQRSAGLSLTTSPQLRELLPTNGYTDCSALLYRNLGQVLESLPEGTEGALPPSLAEVLRSGSEPALLCLYGEPNRIVVAGTGGSLVPLTPLLGAPALGGLVAPDSVHGQDPLSSGA